MPFTLAALAFAVAVSIARGGRFRYLAEQPLAAPWLLFVGVALQVAVDVAAARELLPDAGWSGWLLLLTSQLLVVAFLLANRHLPGVRLVALGLLLNAAVIAANRAMPVDPAAIAALGIEGAEVSPGKHTLLSEDTRLPWLADIIPVPWLRSILSVGDLVIAAGLVPLTHGLLRPPAEPSRQELQAVMVGQLRTTRRRRSARPRRQARTATPGPQELPTITRARRQDRADRRRGSRRR